MNSDNIVSTNNVNLIPIQLALPLQSTSIQDVYSSSSQIHSHNISKKENSQNSPNTSLSPAATSSSPLDFPLPPGSKNSYLTVQSYSPGVLQSSLSVGLPPRPNTSQVVSSNLGNKLGDHQKLLTLGPHDSQTSVSPLEVQINQEELMKYFSSSQCQVI
jgi:hypothetical protein